MQTNIINQDTVIDPKNLINLFGLNIELSSNKIATSENITFIDVFEKQAQENPKAIAVIYDNNILSYKELNEKSNQLAHCLKKLGVKNNDLIGICLERTPKILIAIFGILKMGAAWVPLDPIDPTDRLTDIMEHAEVKIVITSNKNESLIGLPNIKKIKIDSEWSLIAENQKDNPKRQCNSEDLAYVMYTSDHSEKLQSVMVNNVDFYNHLYSVAEILDIQKRCNAPVLTSVTLDVTITSLLLPSFTGGTVTLLPQKNEIDVLQQLLQLKDYYHIAALTPAHLQLLEDLLELKQASIKNIETFVIGGEAINEKILERWKILAPQAKFFNKMVTSS